MYFDMEIGIAKQDEQFALSCLCRENIPEPVLIACICTWESCATLIIKNPHPYSLQMAAAKSWYSCAEHIMQTPELHDLLIACTMHEALATQLANHQDPEIRAACANWESLAEQLQYDPHPGVASASRNTLKFGQPAQEVVH